MLGLKRRRKVEGWALDVAETDAQVGRTTLAQRLAESNKLWIVSFVAVLALSGYLVRTTGSFAPDRVVPPSTRAPENYTDEAHKAFAREFVVDKSYGFKVLDAGFVAPDRFRVVVPGNVSKDDIDYAAAMAGNRIIHEFHFRAVIQVYRRSAGGAESLAATARWEPKKYGYVVKHKSTRGYMP